MPQAASKPGASHAKKAGCDARHDACHPGLLTPCTAAAAPIAALPQPTREFADDSDDVPCPTLNLSTGSLPGLRYGLFISGRALENVNLFQHETDLLIFCTAAASSHHVCNWISQICAAHDYRFFILCHVEAKRKMKISRRVK